MTEKIEVVSIPLANIGGKIVYHGTLVYTNSSGQQFFSGGDIGNAALTAEERRRPDIVARGEAAVLFGVGTSPYGNLVTVTGSVTDPAMSERVQHWLPSTAQRITLAEAPNLANNWVSIAGTMAQILSDTMPYGPVTQNSNSAWCTAAYVGQVLALADIASKFGPYSGNNWVQGCTVLPSVYVERSFFKTSQTEVGGQTMLTIEPTDENGSSLATIKLTEQNQEVIVATPDNWNHYVSGINAVVASDNDSYYIAAGAQITINGTFNSLNVQPNASVLVEGANNDLYTTTANAITLAGDGNWIKALTDIYINGTGNDNSVGKVPASSNVTVEINGSPLETENNARSEDIWGNSLSGSFYALDATNTLKWPESPTAPNPI